METITKEGERFKGIIRPLRKEDIPYLMATWQLVEEV